MALAGLALAQDLLQNAAIVGGLVAASAACAATLVLIFSPRAAALVSFLPGATVVDSIRKYAAHSPQLENTDVWLDTSAGHVLAARGSSAQPQTDA